MYNIKDIVEHKKFGKGIIIDKFNNIIIIKENLYGNK